MCLCIGLTEALIADIVNDNMDNASDKRSIHYNTLLFLLKLPSDKDTYIKLKLCFHCFTEIGSAAGNTITAPKTTSPNSKCYSNKKDSELGANTDNISF